MWRNVIPGQCEARNSVLPLGTRPQAVCFCRDTLNHPCTYVNTERRDTHSQHSERSLWTAEWTVHFLFKILSMKAGRAAHKYISENSNTPPPSPDTCTTQNPSSPRQLTPALPRAAHEFVGLRIPKVRLQVVYFLVQRPLG